MTSAKNVTATFNGTVPTTTYNLSISKLGTGNGNVTSNPSGIDCGPTCSASFNSGTSVTLTAAPSSGILGGGCSGTGTCTLAMNAEKTVTASFAFPTASVVTLITHYYRSILLRDPEPSGLSAYQDNIARAQASGDVKPAFRQMGSDFLNSQEFANRNTSNIEYVVTLYKTFLQREPENPGFQYYLARLVNGEPRNRMITDFTNSAEFAQIMKDLGF